MGAVVLGDHHQAARRPCRGGARCPAAARRRCPTGRRRRPPGNGASSALTSVPRPWPGAGWTTSPAGLSSTSRCSSSYSTSSGIASAAGRAGDRLRHAEREALARFDPARRRRLSGRRRGSTAPASSRARRRARDSSGSRAARNLSTRWPASAAAAVTVRVLRIIGGQGGQHPAPAQGLCDRRRRRAGRRHARCWWRCWCCARPAAARSPGGRTWRSALPRGGRDRAGGGRRRALAAARQRRRRASSSWRWSTRARASAWACSGCSRSAERRWPGRATWSRSRSSGSARRATASASIGPTPVYVPLALPGRALAGAARRAPRRGLRRPAARGARRARRGSRRPAAISAPAAAASCSICRPPTTRSGSSRRWSQALARRGLHEMCRWRRCR